MQQLSSSIARLARGAAARPLAAAQPQRGLSAAAAGSRIRPKNVVQLGTTVMKLVPPTASGKDYGRKKVVFKVVPSMTKHEVKEYLQKVYNVPVAAVNTMNYDGKWKRAGVGKKFGRFLYRERDWKKAVVTLKSEDDNPFLAALDEERAERRAAAESAVGGEAGGEAGDGAEGTAAPRVGS